MLRIFLLLAVLFFKTISWSANSGPVTRIQMTATSKNYWTLYSDNGVTKIDVIQEKNSEPQQVIQTWGFSDFKKAEKFYNLKTKGLNLFSEQLWNGETENVKTQVNKKLWEATNTWNWDWELKYAQWIAQNVDKTFMQKYQLPSDCADLAYTVRWIFARNNSLPMASKLSSTGKLMTHETVLKEWENLSTNPDWTKDKLFRTALRYLTRQTYTHTLMRDSYPIAINPESMTEGVHHLQLHGPSGHTMLVYKVDHSGGAPLRVLYSNVPIEIRELYESPFNDISWPEENQRAFLRFRWPQKSANGWNLVAAAKMPFYSLEQFSKEIQKEGASFFIVAYKRVSPNFDPLILVNETMNSIFSQLENRVHVVDEGYRYCLTHDCQPGTAGDEDWSTPSRDKRLRETYDALAQAINLYIEITSELNIPEDVLKKMKNYRLSIQGQDVSFVSIYVSSALGFLESDPRASVDERWSVKPAAIAMRLEKKLTSLFKIRDEKIKSVGSCSAIDCPLASKAWQEKSTVSEDIEIAGLFHRLRMVCGAFKESCAEFNQFLKKSSAFKNFFSRAITQHSSASSTLIQRQGLSEARAQFVPGNTVPVILSENIFFQPSKIYRQGPEDIFPEILCSEAQINPKDQSNLVCIHRQDSNLEYVFLNRQLQELNKVSIPQGKQLVMNQYWSSNGDVYIIYFTDHIQLYNSQGQFIGELMLPDRHQIVGNRWLASLDTEKFLQYLDLTQVQKGLIRQRIHTFQDISAAESQPIGNTGYFLITDPNGVNVTNAEGENIFSAEVSLIENHDNGKTLLIRDIVNGFKNIKIYQFEVDTFKLITEFNGPANSMDWGVQKSALGFFYGDKKEGYSIFTTADRRHNYLPWTKDKTIHQIEESDVLTFDLERDSEQYSLYTFDGRLLLKNPFILLQNDALFNLKRVSFFTDQIIYNQVHRNNQFSNPVFSNSGFFYLIQNKDENSTVVFHGEEVPNTYLFSVANTRIPLHLLTRLGYSIDYSSVMLTMPTPIDLQ